VRAAVQFYKKSPHLYPTRRVGGLLIEFYVQLTLLLFFTYFNLRLLARQFALAWLIY